MLSLHAKILNGLFSIVILTERGLPTASVMREMTEAIIALSYMATDPVPLVEKYASAPNWCSSCVEPSMSVKRKVAVPEGKLSRTDIMMLRRDAGGQDVPSRVCGLDLRT